MKKHIHIGAVIAAIGAGATALSGALPDNLDNIPLVVLAISLAITAAVNAYDANEPTPDG